MGKKNIVSTSEESLAHKLKAFAKKKKGIRRGFTAEEKKISIQANKLAVIAREKEDVRRKLVVTAKKLEKFDETLEQKIAERTAELKESYATLEQKVRDRTQDLENANMASRNVLEDFEVEKEALADAKAKDEALLESIGEGVVAVDRDGKIILINHAAEHMLGLSAEQAVGKVLVGAWEVLDEKGKPVPEAERPIAVALGGRTISTVAGTSYFYTRKNGIKFPVAITVTPVIIDNKIIGAVDVFRDITKEKEIEKLRVDFLALASHQLRTPLSGTKWLIETMQKGLTGKIEPKEKEYLDDLYQMNERMLKLVFDMLSVLRIESGAGQIKKEVVSVEDLYEGIVALMAAPAESKGVILNCI